MFQWQTLRLASEVQREKFDRLDSELKMIKLQWADIKQTYDSANEAYKKVMGEIAEKRQLGIERVNALLIDPKKPEILDPGQRKTDRDP